MAFRLRFTKKSDGETVMTAIRHDGSATWTRIGSANGFGPIHDLAHFVVETSLALPEAFLGLLAKGRNIEDFDRGTKQWLTEDGYVAEAVAGQLSQDSAAGIPLSAKDFNLTVRESLSRVPIPVTAPELSAEQLAAMQQRLQQLREQWKAITPGDSLELEMG
jgi:hypothetical protein